MLVEKIKILLDLVAKKVNVDKKIESLEKKISEEEFNKNKISNQVTELEESLKSEKKHIASLELSINSLADKEKNLKTRLPVLTRSKEIEALNKEIFSFQDSRTAYEDELLECLDTVEGLEKEIKLISPDIATAVEKIDSEIDQLKKEISSINQDRTEFLNEINTASIDLPEEFKQKYSRALAKLSNPIVPIRDSACSFCYNFITPQRLNELRKSKIGECNNCGRILFINE